MPDTWSTWLWFGFARAIKRQFTWYEILTVKFICQSQFDNKILTQWPLMKLTFSLVFYAWHSLQLQMPTFDQLLWFGFWFLLILCQYRVCLNSSLLAPRIHLKNCLKLSRHIMTFAHVLLDLVFRRGLTVLFDRTFLVDVSRLKAKCFNNYMTLSTVA